MPLLGFGMPGGTRGRGFGGRGSRLSIFFTSLSKKKKIVLSPRACLCLLTKSFELCESLFTTMLRGNVRGASRKGAHAAAAVVFERESATGLEAAAANAALSARSHSLHECLYPMFLCVVRYNRMVSKYRQSMVARRWAQKGARGARWTRFVGLPFFFFESE